MLGFSRANGYDINDPLSRKKIIEQTKNCDIFINNAWCDSSQTSLLIDMIELWKDTERLIVNISSKSSYLDKTHTMYDIMQNHTIYHNYINDKKAQNRIVRSRIFNSTPKIMNLILGAVDTDMSKDLTSPKMDANIISDFIINLINIRNVILVQDITIDHPCVTTVK